MIKITNEEIAERVARVVYKSKEEKSDDFAVQLMVEKLLIPVEIKSYSKKEVKQWILDVLNVEDNLKANIKINGGNYEQTY